MKLVVLPFLVLFGLSQAAIQCGNVVCFHNSQCVQSAPDFSDHPTFPDGTPFEFHDYDDVSYHCSCTERYTGVDCSIPVENCQDGTHRCYNGGTCYDDDPDRLPYCDCSAAVDLSDGTKYVGKYCEQSDRPVKDSYCEHVNQNSFCLNGGTCNPDFPASTAIPCKCLSGYKGAHCEFADNSVKDCTLTCSNGGFCVLGESSNNAYQDSNANDHMHCRCPDGFGGPDCAMPITPCGRSNCLNGGVCVTEEDGITGEIMSFCMCDQDYVSPTHTYYAGQYCEHASEKFCDVLGGQAYFCTNGGECPASFFQQQACNCLEGTAGIRCEYIECTLDCQNGSECIVGDPPAGSEAYRYWLDHEDHHNYQYCDCLDGFTGKACEISSGNACGDFACLNGGQCVTRTDALGNEQYYCDCIPAFDSEEKRYYDGRMCQYGSTSICFDDVENSEIFYCTNNGQCQEDYMKGCLCPEGFAGFSCEFVVGRDCTLDCQNGGECVLGSPPSQSYLHAYWYNADDFTNWQYCSCPGDWGGELCELPAEDCGDFFCLNGGSCTGVDGNPMEGRCNCVNAVSGDTFYDGLYCQFPSTSICGETADEVYFCVNGGECPTADDEACRCPEGFGGFYCELMENVDCTEDCGPQGTCQLGAPPGQSNAHAYWYDAAAAADYQYCECDDGWGGKYCEFEGRDCGGFTCLNGGSCLGEFGQVLTDRCNCVGAWDEGINGLPNTYYEGRFCQFESTSVCFENREDVFFCANGGTCRDNYLDGCSCLPGYAGFSCEFLEGTDCTLDCGLNGECRLGAPPGGSVEHAYWVNDGENYQYCECKNNASGEKCEITSGEDCGDFTCLNGGSCTLDGKPLVDRCNCIDAWTPGTNGQPNTYYDGRFCQYASTSICLETDEQVIFCMNNGECNDADYSQGCICPPGFSGFSCEFLEGTDCTLECGANGECRLGAPPSGSHEHAYWFDASEQDNYQYCECADAYGGKYCETAGDNCGDFTCLNGGTCKQDGVALADRCNCLDAWSPGQNGEPDTYYDGRFCQYPSTSICHMDGEDVYFCMNNGYCREEFTKGCGCPEGYAGFSCEFLEGTDCTLDCNVGTCRLGEPPEESYLHAYWFDPSRQNNYQYCECPDGTNGKECDSTAVDCGDFLCLNGGKCESERGQPMQGRCNCIEAMGTIDGITTYYDGLFCQFASTSICFEDDDQAYFCMNDGKCQQDFTFGCVCQGGYAGFYCELLEGQDCTLDCKNGGQCKLGSPPGISVNDAYWYNEDKEDQYQYCQCAEGFSGPTCEAFGAKKCGQSPCFNGGTCIERAIAGSVVHHCDCRDADHNGKFYAGKFCQYEATEVCQEEEYAVYFCVNDGDCRDDFRMGCTCKEGTGGFSCEFVLDENVGTSSSGTAPDITIIDDPGSATCDLDCNARGTCRNGVKDIGDLGDAANANHLSYSHENFQHCVCDDGWTGVTCDHKITKCDDSNGHFCLHGSQCVVDNAGMAKCDCSTAQDQIAEKFAGDFCEHTADVCVTASDASPTSYCANGGTCKAYHDNSGASHPGCTCPKGFTGDRCQLTINKSDAKSSAEDGLVRKKDGSMSGLGIAAIVLTACATLAVALICIGSCVRRKRVTRRNHGETSGLIWADKKGYKDNLETVNFAAHKGYQDDYMASFASPSRDPMATAFAPNTSDAVESDISTGKSDEDDGPQIFIGPPTDEDGHVLHNVDII